MLGGGACGNVFKADGAWPRTSIDPRKWTWQHIKAIKWQKQEHINIQELRMIQSQVEEPHMEDGGTGGTEGVLAVPELEGQFECIILWTVSNRTWRR